MPFGVLLKVPCTPPAAAASTGKFWWLFAPVSPSPASFVVTPAGPRLIPRVPLEKIELPTIACPVPSKTFTPFSALWAMTFAAPAAVPPIVVPFPSMNNPLMPFGTGHGSGGVRADAVAVDDRARRARGVVDAVGSVAGNHVAGAGGGSTDDRSRHAVEADAIRRIAERLAACGVEPDQVALDAVPVRGRLHEDTALAVAGNDVARAGLCAADDVGAGAGLKDDATVRVQHRGAAQRH